MTKNPNKTSAVFEKYFDRSLQLWMLPWRALQVSHSRTLLR